jgi:hypothetical protein
MKEEIIQLHIRQGRRRMFATRIKAGAVNALREKLAAAKSVPDIKEVLSDIIAHLEERGTT